MSMNPVIRSCFSVQMNSELLCLLVLLLTYTYLVEKKMRFADSSNEGKKQHITLTSLQGK